MGPSVDGPIVLGGAGQPSRYPIARCIRSLRTPASVMPSNPKPKYRVSLVETTAPSGNPAAVVRTKLFGLGALPGGGPLAAQPSRLVSNDVEPSPVVTTTSSTNT